MINFNKILKFFFAFLKYVWQKIIGLFFVKKKSTITKEIKIWQCNQNTYKSTFFQNKNAIRSKKIRPFKRKIRGLDIENGGTEQSDDKTQKHIKDIWDDRAKNLLKVGQVSPISSNNKKAMLVWYAKLLKTQAKLELLGKKAAKSKKKLDIPKQIGNNFDSSKTTTFAQKISATKKLDNNQILR